MSSDYEAGAWIGPIGLEPTNELSLENGLDALFVDFTCSSPCRFFFRTFLVLFLLDMLEVPKTPHPNRFLD